MLCFLCCFSGSRRLCFCPRSRGRQLCVVSTSDMTIVEARKGSMDSYRKRLKHPRRTHSEPPIKTGRVFIRYCSLREKRHLEKKRSNRFQVSMVSIPSSFDPRRSVRKSRRKWLSQRREQELSVSSLSDESVPSEPRLHPEMDRSVDQNGSQEMDGLDEDTVDTKRFNWQRTVGKSQSFNPSREAVLVNGDKSSRSSSFELPKGFEIERLNLESPPVQQSDKEPDEWHLKDSYKQDLEQYVNSDALPSNPWTDPFEDDRRSRTEQWIESITPERVDDSETDDLPSPPQITSSSLEEKAKEQKDNDEEEEEGVPVTIVPVDQEDEPLLEPKTSFELKGVEADVEFVWEEEAVKKEEVIHDVTVKLNGGPHKATIRRMIPLLETQESLDAPPSEISVVSSTVEKVSLVQQNYRNNLHSALEHSGDSVSLKEVERFWEYQYNSPEQQKVADEKRRRRELERIRGYTPTMERVVMYYTSDKRPSLITISPSPVPSVRSSSSFSDAYRLFDRRSATPSPRPPRHSRLSFESEELNMSMEKDNLAEEITIEVPHLTVPVNTDTSFFHLDANSSDEEEAGGLVEIPSGKTSPVRRLFVSSPHPRRLRVSRGTSTEDLSLSVGRTTDPEKRFHSTLTQTDESMADSRGVCFLMIDPSAPKSASLSDMSSTSLEDFLASDLRPSSSSPSKSVHFSHKIDADIDHLPKHQPDPLFHSPKPILKRIDSKTAELRKVMELAADRLYKDLRMLIEERDRCLHALEIIPSENKDLSIETAVYQTNYRDKLLENKGVLDAKIDHFWNRLKNMPLSETQSTFVYGVENSKALTLNMKRKVIPVRFVNAQNPNVVRRSEKTNLEMASDYAKKLADMRKAMIRRDSDIVQDDEKSVEEILKRVSASMASLKSA